MKEISQDFEKELYKVTAKHFDEIRDLFRKHKDKERIDDRKATLVLMWYIDMFIRLGWKGNKSSDVLTNIREIILQQENNTTRGGSRWH